MRSVIQRVTSASVTVNGQMVSVINQGLLILIGITHGDTKSDADWLVKKIINLRIFNDSDGKLNHSIRDVNGELLVVSQFTLYGDAVKGNRPSFTKAAPPPVAIPVYEYFLKQLANSGLSVRTGVFGADMQVSLVNNGPTTIILESSSPTK